MNKVKLTLYIEEAIIKKAKHFVLDLNKSLSEFIEDLLKREVQ